MITPDHILELIRTEPFHPFRIHVSDGKVYEIRHPESVFVGQRTLTIGIRGREGHRPPYRETSLVSLLHVTRLEKEEAEVV